MTLNDWIKRHPTEQRAAARARLAAALGVSEVYIRSMANGHRRVPAEMAAVIERHTGGAVTRAELRPDVFGDQSPRRTCPC